VVESLVTCDEKERKREKSWTKRVKVVRKTAKVEGRSYLVTEGGREF
jgi:hypothetical protein